jgi:hypothetical protein
MNRLPAKHIPKALLGYVVETCLAGGVSGETVPVSSPWDVWWVAYRAAIPLGQLGIHVTRHGVGCAECDHDAIALAGSSPPRHPDAAGGRPCECLLAWAIRMRAPAEPPRWPQPRLTLALLKPGAPHEEIRTALERTHDVLKLINTTLTTGDTRRLYPEAYGADYVSARDAYMTSGPVQVLVLRTRCARAGTAAQIKESIRVALGADLLRNHLHMPDNPGEALADIAHLTGPETLANLYERHERDRSAERLAFYRAALGIRSSDVDRRGV